jgi:carboxylesterase
VGVLPGAEPYAHDGGPVGVVFCHGFTGSPQSLRGWAEAVAGAGHSVRLPLLPGHGTTWQEMNRTGWQQWYAEVDAAFADLSTRCESVLVAGLSMGGALALRLAEQHGDAVAGVLLVNPAVRLTDPRLRALPAVRRVVPSLAGIASDIKKPGAAELAYDRTPLNALASSLRFYAVVLRDLGAVRQPVLLFRSAQDHVVPAVSSARVLAGVSSTDVTEVVLHDSYHVATLDNDAPAIVEESLAFVERVARASRPGQATR